MNLGKKKGLFLGLGACGLLTVGFGVLIYFAQSSISEQEAVIASKRSEVANAQTKAAELPALEKRVILLREIVEEYLKILPDEKEVTDFIRKLYAFQDKVGVQITELQDKTGRSSGRKGATKAEPGFDQLSYSLKLQADTWKFLAFLNRLESYERFVRIPRIRVSAGDRSKDDDPTKVRHEFDLDIETYVFDPADSKKNEAKVDKYEKRVAEMQDEIARAREKILAEPFEFHGPRGRRDPFLDPRLRIPKEGGGEAALQRQLEIVEGLRADLARIGQLALEYDQANQMIRRFELRRDIDQSIQALMDRVGKVQKEGKVSYLPLVRRLQKDVLDGISELRGRFDSKGGAGGAGPSREELQDLTAAMRENLAEGQFTIAIDRFQLVAERLKPVEDDPERRDLALELQKLHHQARMALEFGKKKIEVDGIIVSDQGSVAVINGRSFGEGDYVDDDILVRRILPDSIEFQYRDVVISKKI